MEDTKGFRHKRQRDDPNYKRWHTRSTDTRTRKGNDFTFKVPTPHIGIQGVLEFVTQSVCHVFHGLFNTIHLSVYLLIV